LSNDVSEEYITSIFKFEEQVKQESNMKQAASKSGFLLGLFFCPEYGEDIFLRNVG
jgi:hypothetical protein